MSAILDVFIDRRRAAVAGAAEGAWRGEGADLGATLAALAAYRVGTHPARARVWLGGDLCRPFLLPPLTGLRDRAERVRAAQAMAPARTGLSGPCRLWLEEGVTSGPASAVAMAQAEHAQTIEALRRVSLKPASLAPWWSAALRAALSERPGLRAFAVFDGAGLTIAMGTAGTFSVLETIAPIDSEVARDTWRRRLFAEGADAHDSGYAELDAATASDGAGAPAGLPLREAVNWRWGDA